MFFCKMIKREYKIQAEAEVVPNSSSVKKVKLKLSRCNLDENLMKSGASQINIDANLMKLDATYMDNVDASQMHLDDLV